MVCLGFEPGTAGGEGSKAQMNPLSYGGPASFGFGLHNTGVIDS